LRLRQENDEEEEEIMAAPKVTAKEKATEKKTGRTIIAKGKSLPRGKASEKRKEPGMGSLGKWKDVSKKNFAGPEGTFPIQDMPHARNALARAHFAKNPEAVKKKVYSKYPGLKKRHEERSPKK
jgi:hypothetical protein